MTNLATLPEPIRAHLLDYCHESFGALALVSRGMHEQVNQARFKRLLARGAVNLVKAALYHRENPTTHNAFLSKIFTELSRFEIVNLPGHEMPTRMLSVFNAFQTPVKTLTYRNCMRLSRAHFASMPSHFVRSLKSLEFKESFHVACCCYSEFLGSLHAITTTFKALQNLTFDKLDYAHVHECMDDTHCTSFQRDFWDAFKIENLTKLNQLKIPKKVGPLCFVLPSAKLSKLTQMVLLDLTGWRVDGFAFLHAMPDLKAYTHQYALKTSADSLAGYRSETLEILDLKAMADLTLEHVMSWDLPALKRLDISCCPHIKMEAEALEVELKQKFPKLEHLVC